jgi:prepilin-type N-terminal cleavage/methylation domain-containing protein
MRTNDGFSMFSRRVGYTLIELLTVLAIIGMLASMLVGGAIHARKKARIAKAQSEVKELSKAWKAYWMVYKKWPKSCEGQRNVKMTVDKMSILTGVMSMDNERALAFMQVDPGVMVNGFIDPWGKLYQVDFDISNVPQPEDVYQTTVFISQKNRYSYRKKYDFEP